MRDHYSCVLWEVAAIVPILMEEAFETCKARRFSDPHLLLDRELRTSGQIEPMLREQVRDLLR